MHRLNVVAEVHTIVLSKAPLQVASKDKILAVVLFNAILGPEHPALSHRPKFWQQTSPTGQLISEEDARAAIMQICFFI